MIHDGHGLNYGVVLFSLVLAFFVYGYVVRRSKRQVGLTNTMYDIINADGDIVA